MEVTLLEMKTEARERADQVNSAFVSDPELTNYINSAARELYDLFIQAYENDYNVQKKEITVDGIDTAQIAEVTFPAGNAVGLNNSWFTFSTTENLIGYYAWFNIDGGGTDPDIGGLIGVELVESSGSTASQVANCVAVRLNALAGFSATDTGAVMTLVWATTGIAKDPANQGLVPGFSTVTTTEGHDKDRYRAPTGMYKVIGVDATENTNDPYTLKPFSFAERNRYKNNGLGFGAGIGRNGSIVSYHLSDGNVILIPEPTLTTLTFWFIPILPKLFSDTDTLEVFNGWHEFIIIKAARKMKMKEESDTTDLDTDLALVTQRISDVAENRNADVGFQVIDMENVHVSGNFGEYDY